MLSEFISSKTLWSNMGKLILREYYYEDIVVSSNLNPTKDRQYAILGSLIC